MQDYASVPTPPSRRAGRPSAPTLLLLGTTLAALVLSGCRANPNEQARIAELHPRFDRLTVTVDEMQREHALQQERIAAVQLELAKLREKALPGVAPAAVAPPTRSTGLPVITTQPVAVRDPARTTTGDRFLRNFAILCFIGFLAVQIAKIMRKRRQDAAAPVEPEPSGTSSGATVFHPNPTDTPPAPSATIYTPASAAQSDEESISLSKNRPEVVPETPEASPSDQPEDEFPPKEIKEEAAAPLEAEAIDEQPGQGLPGLSDISPGSPQGKESQHGRKDKRRNR